MGPSSSSASFRLMAAETVIDEDCCGAAPSAKLPAVATTNRKRRLATTSLLPMNPVLSGMDIATPLHVVLIRFLLFRRGWFQSGRRRRRRTLRSLTWRCWSWSRRARRSGRRAIGRQHLLQLRIIVHHAAQSGKGCSGFNLLAGDAHLLVHIRHLLHDALADGRFVEFGQDLNVVHGKVLGVDGYNRVIDGGGRNASCEFLRERVHEFRQLLRRNRAAYAVVHLPSYVTCDVCAHLRAFGNVHQMPDGSVLSGIYFFRRRRRRRRRCLRCRVCGSRLSRCSVRRQCWWCAGRGCLRQRRS